MSGPEPEDAERPVPHPFDYVTRDQIQDLWGIGYTIIKRSRHPDPFFVPPEMVPHGRSYQWWHLVQDRALFEHTGWAAVPASRHEGHFMPFGHIGPIEVSGLGLFEKPKFEVDAERASQVKAAQQQVSDWAKKVKADGLSGSFSIGGQKFDVTEPMSRADLDKKTKTINTTVGVPADMFPHMAELYAERDRLYAELEKAWSDMQAGKSPLVGYQLKVMARYDEALEEDPDLAKGPAMNALLLPYAVANVRAKLENEAKIQCMLGAQTPLRDELKAKIAKLKEGKTDE